VVDRVVLFRGSSFDLRFGYMSARVAKRKRPTRVTRSRTYLESQRLGVGVSNLQRLRDLDGEGPYAMLSALSFVACSRYLRWMVDGRWPDMTNR